MARVSFAAVIPGLLTVLFSYLERGTVALAVLAGGGKCWPQNDAVRLSVIEKRDPCIGSTRRAQGARALPAFSVPA